MEQPIEKRLPFEIRHLLIYVGYLMVQSIELKLTELEETDGTILR